MVKRSVIYTINLISRLYNGLLLLTVNGSISKGASIRGILVVRGKGYLEIGDSCIINSNTTRNPVGLGKRTMFYIARHAQIVIGSNVGISTSLLYARSKIVIEDNVLIGGGCQLLDSDFHSLDYWERVHNGDNKAKSLPIVIQEGAFVGASSIILKGVTIGKHSIVAAGSVVSKSIPAGEIWGGNPAKFIRKAEE